MSQVPFMKAVALGNDFIIVDLRNSNLELPVHKIKTLADRRNGIGCDQVIFILTPTDPKADARLVFYNADGSEAEACGNGTRCVARLLMEQMRKNAVYLQTADKVCHAYLADKANQADVTVILDKPRFAWDEIPLAHKDALAHVEYDNLTPCCVNVGNPHVVFFVKDVEAVPLARIGPQIENHPAFPERVNVGFAEILNDRSLRLRVWERGAGYTMACGTGACAAAAAAIHTNILSVDQSPIRIRQNGGDILVEWQPDGSIIMTGPAQLSFQGLITL